MLENWRVPTLTMNLVVLTTTAMEMVQYPRDKLNRLSQAKVTQIAAR